MIEQNMENKPVPSDIFYVSSIRPFLESVKIYLIFLGNISIIYNIGMCNDFVSGIVCRNNEK